jgi:hypothetical protein
MSRDRPAQHRQQAAAGHLREMLLSQPGAPLVIGDLAASFLREASPEHVFPHDPDGGTAGVPPPAPRDHNAYGVPDGVTFAVHTARGGVIDVARCYPPPLQDSAYGMAGTIGSVAPEDAAAFQHHCAALTARRRAKQGGWSDASDVVASVWNSAERVWAYERCSTGRSCVSAWLRRQKHVVLKSTHRTTPLRPARGTVARKRPRSAVDDELDRLIGVSSKPAESNE